MSTDLGSLQQQRISVANGHRVSGLAAARPAPKDDPVEVQLAAEVTDRQTMEAMHTHGEGPTSSAGQHDVAPQPSSEPIVTGSAEILEAGSPAELQGSSERGTVSLEQVQRRMREAVAAQAAVVGQACFDSPTPQNIREATSAMNTASSSVKPEQEMLQREHIAIWNPSAAPPAENARNLPPDPLQPDLLQVQKSSTIEAIPASQSSPQHIQVANWRA